MDKIIVGLVFLVALIAIFLLTDNDSTSENPYV